MTNARTSGLWLWALGLAVLLAAYATMVVVPAIRHQTHGYAVLYTSARLVREGNPGVLYDRGAFDLAIERYGIQHISDIFDANPPTTALLLLPLAGLSADQARTIWILGNVALLPLIAVMIAGLLRDLGLAPRLPRNVLAAGILAALLLYHPIAVNLRLGQSYVLVLALLTTALLALLRNRYLAAGLALAGIVSIKGYYGFMLLLPLLATRQWRAAAIAGIASLAVALATLPLLGLAAWHGYVRSSSSLANEPSSTVTAYQTIHSVIGHLLWRDPRWNPQPLLLAGPGPWSTADLSLPTTLLWYGGAVLLVASALVGGARVLGSERLAWAGRLLLMVPAALLAAPMAEEYHYSLLALPLLVLWGTTVTERAAPARWGPLALATALAAAPLPTSGLAFHGAASLLYYSKLVAALLVLVAAIDPIRQRAHAVDGLPLGTKATLALPSSRRML